MQAKRGGRTKRGWKRARWDREIAHTLGADGTEFRQIGKAMQVRKAKALELIASGRRPLEAYIAGTHYAAAKCGVSVGAILHEVQVQKGRAEAAKTLRRPAEAFQEPEKAAAVQPSLVPKGWEPPEVPEGEDPRFPRRRKASA